MFGCSSSNNQHATDSDAFSVVTNRGYLLGIACRINPINQAIANSDRAKLPVNRRWQLIRHNRRKLCHTSGSDAVEF